MPHNLHNSLQTFTTASGKNGQFYSLPALEKAGVGKISRLPVSIRIVLEAVLRNCDGKKVTEAHVQQLRVSMRFPSLLRALFCKTSRACPFWPT